MTGDDEKGPMQDARKTRDVMKASPAPKPDDDEPKGTPTDAATQSVETDQEDA